MPPVGFEPTIPSGDRPQTHALYRAATGTGDADIFKIMNDLTERNCLLRLERRTWAQEAILRFQPHIQRLIALLHTYSMVQSPWEGNWFAVSQEIPSILWNPMVHYRTQKRPPSAPILGQPNPVHIPTSHLLEIHPNIIHTSMPRSPQWSLSLRFPHQDPICPPLLTHTRHMPSPSHYITPYNFLNV